MSTGSDTSASSGNAATPVQVVVVVAGIVCALALVTALLLHTQRQRRRLSVHSPITHKPLRTPRTLADRLANKHRSIYKSDIWQSIDLGKKNRPESLQHKTPPHKIKDLDGFEAAKSGYDPDAKIMTPFQINKTDHLLATPMTAGAVTIRFEDVKDIVPDEDEFYHQLPERAHMADIYASAPSPLYTEFPMGEKW